MQFIFTRNPHLKPRYVCGFSKGRRTNTLKTFCSGQATYAHLRALAGVVGLEPTIVRLTVECCTNSAIPQYIQGSLKCINQLCYLSQVDGMGLEPIILLKKICCMSLFLFLIFYYIYIITLFFIKIKKFLFFLTACSLSYTITVALVLYYQSKLNSTYPQGLRVTGLKNSTGNPFSCLKNFFGAGNETRTRTKLGFTGF